VGVGARARGSRGGAGTVEAKRVSPPSNSSRGPPAAVCCPIGPQPARSAQYSWVHAGGSERQKFPST
jgi:hypothetical protein